METNDPRRQLADVERLQKATEIEQYRMSLWAMPVLAVAAALLVVAFATGHSAVVIAAIVAWDLFVLAWLLLIRRPSRVRQAPKPSATGLRDSLVPTLLANAIFWPLFLLFGYKVLVVLGALYVAYLVYISLGDVRQRVKYGHR